MPSASPAVGCAGAIVRANSRSRYHTVCVASYDPHPAGELQVLKVSPRIPQGSRAPARSFDRDDPSTPANRGWSDMTGRAFRTVYANRRRRWSHLHTSVAGP